MIIPIPLLLIVLKKYKATVNLVATQVMVMRMGHLFTQDLNRLGYYLKQQQELKIGDYLIIQETHKQETQEISISHQVQILLIPLSLIQ